MTLARRLADKASGFNAPVTLTANYTVTALDCNRTFVYNGGAGTNINIEFPYNLPDGFVCRVENAGQGTVSFTATGGYAAHYGNAGRTGLIFQWDVVDIEIYSVLIGQTLAKLFQTTYNLGLPVLYAASNAAATRAVTALSAIPGLTINLEAGGAYDIDVLVPFTTTATTQSIRVGLGTLPTNSTCLLEAVVWNTGSPGTAPKSNSLMTTPALAITGAAGTASVVSTTLLARITGRIWVPTDGVLQVTCGAISTASTLTVAQGAATLSAFKVFDLGRT